MTLDEMIEVLQAAKEGKKIEFTPKSMGNWKIIEIPAWDFYNLDYRVKREPKEYWAALKPSCDDTVNYISDYRNAVEYFIKYNGGTLIHLKEISVA